MRNRGFDYDEHKLGELIVYIASKCEKHVRFGATKLNKILFYADFIAYENLGKPITGAEYQKLPHGPAPVRLLPVQAQLVALQAVVKREGVTPGGYTEKRLVPLRRANLKGFEPDEIAVVDEVIEAFKDASAVAVSEFSHRMPGWKFALDNEVIPYFTALLPEDVGPLSTGDATWAGLVVERFASA
ncbi:MAG: SocA family protein [Anaeromyxobacter sp.]|nr:SocA family protein [Anaeromyxobacter sp.]